MCSDLISKDCAFGFVKQKEVAGYVSRHTSGGVVDVAFCNALVCYQIMCVLLTVIVPPIDMGAAAVVLSGSGYVTESPLRLGFFFVDLGCYIDPA